MLQCFEVQAFTPRSSAVKAEASNGVTRDELGGETTHMNGRSEGQPRPVGGGQRDMTSSQNADALHHGFHRLLKMITAALVGLKHTACSHGLCAFGIRQASNPTLHGGSICTA